MFTLLTLAACGVVDTGDKVEPEDTGSTDTILPPDDTTETGDTEDTGELEIVYNASLHGLLRVALTTTDELGNTSEVSWDDATGGTWVFGRPWIGAFTRDEAGNATWLAGLTIVEPDTAGNEYSLSVNAPEGAEIWLQAYLDYYGDGIIGSSDPSALYSDPVLLMEDMEVDDIDLTIYTTAPSGGGGGIDTSVYVTLSGELTSDKGYAGWPCMAMIYDTAYNGPYFYTSAAMQDDGAGTGVGAFSLPAYSDWGDITVVGGCDVSNDGLLDPTDQWGALVEGGSDANPLDVGTTNEENLEVLVPFDGFRPFSSPFVNISGSISYFAGFSSLPSEAVLYVGAMRSLHEGEFETSLLSFAYDVERVEVGTLSGDHTEYSLTVPANSTSYIWAWIDTDNDGVLNEFGEPVGNAITSEYGAVVTTTVNVDSVSFGISQVEEQARVVAGGAASALSQGHLVDVPA